MTKTWICSSALMLLLGCGGGGTAARDAGGGGDVGAGPATPSCNIGGSLCWENANVPSSRLPDLEASCTSGGGTWNAAVRCSRAGSFGGCLETRGDGEMTTWYYAGSATDQASVRQTCTDNGQTYVAP